MQTLTVHGTQRKISGTILYNPSGGGSIYLQGRTKLRAEDTCLFCLQGFLQLCILGLVELDVGRCVLTLHVGELLLGLVRCSRQFLKFSGDVKEKISGERVSQTYIDIVVKSC